MVSYAYLSIIKDWRRNMSIIILLALSGLLFIYNTSELVGYMEESSRDILDLDAPIWLMPKPSGPRLAALQVGITDKNIGERLVWRHINVIGVRPLMTPVMMRIADTDNPFTFIRLVSVGLAPGALTYPRSFPAEFQDMLKVPGSVIMRRSDADTLGLDVGDQFSVTSLTASAKPKSLILVGIVNERRGGFIRQAYGSPDTMRYLSPSGGSSGGGIKAYAVKLRNPAAKAQTARDLNFLLASKGKTLVALTGDQMLENSKQLSTLQEAAGQRLRNLVTIVTGFVLIMTTLLMRTNFLSQIKEFGTLNALGVSKWRLATLMLQQGFLIGLFACGLSGLVFMLLKTALQPFNIFLITTPQIFTAILVILVLIAMLSSFFSVFVLRKIELTSLLR